MAKSRVHHKAHKTRKTSGTNRILFLTALFLIAVGILVYVLQNNKSTELAQAPAEEVVNVNGADIGPNRGCEEIDFNYVCDIKVKNPSESTLSWSVMIDGLEGAYVSEEKGTLSANSESMIQLSVPQDFCANNPDTQGNVTVVDDTMVSNQAKTTFNCAFLEQ